ncbi:MAG: lytic transglycosylase domain-containing protein [Deltaproteobacteria bacterium]|jgi:soluble lytic murein transglycosylase-like protein
MNTRLPALLWFSLLTVFILPSVGFTDVYVYKDKQGVLTFTNVPSHAGYRRVFRDSNGQLSGAVASLNGYDDLIRSASGRYSIDGDLIRAVIKTESDFNSTARSNKGAMGLMQLMPETARLHDVVNAYDPVDNIEGGVRHLRLLLDRYQGNLELSLAAYNAGIKAVEKFGGIPPFTETKEYIRRVLQNYQAYRSNGLQFFQQAQQ